MTIIDGATRGRPGKFIVDYRDANGKRRTPSFDTEKEAEEFAKKELGYRNNGKAGTVNPNITLPDFVPHCVDIWEEDELEAATIEGHLQALNDHILPYFKNARVSEPTRRDIVKFKDHLKHKRARCGKQKAPIKTGRLLQKATIRNIVNTASSVFTIAVEEGIRPDNPAARLGRRKNKRPKAEERIQPIAVRKALTKQERDRTLVVARLLLNDLHYTALCLLAGTGLRPGEARALRWQHLDLDGSQGIHEGVPMLSVEETFKRHGRLGCTKGKERREVEIEAALCAWLRYWKHVRQPRPTDFVLSEDGGRSAVPQTQFNQTWPYVLGLAGLDRWLPLYCLRHTYASILVRAGVSPAFVCRQLGHVNTATTEKYYANWLPQNSHGALTKLGLGAAMVVPPVATTPQPPSAPEGTA